MEYRVGIRTAKNMSPDYIWDQQRVGCYGCGIDGVNLVRVEHASELGINYQGKELDVP
jgi:hypothetical protein